MISERKFSEIYNSFWQELLPTGERFIRKINLSLERFCVPVKTESMAEDRGLINESAFRLFIKWAEKGLKEEIPKSFIPVVSKDAFNFIKRFRDTSLDKSNKLSNEGKKEVIEIANNLKKYFMECEKNTEIIFFPKFSGYGIVSDCEGDLISKTSLHEIKSGDRGFRLIDIRQILVYCALSHAKKTYNIKNVVLLNPRRGVFFSVGVDLLCRELSGSNMQTVFQDILDFVSQPQTSI